MNRQVGWLNENIRPNASHQILLADQLSMPFKQSNQDFQSATSETHGLVAVQQKELSPKQAKWSERDFRWRCARWFGSFLKEWPSRIHTLNGAFDLKLRFGMKLLQTSESCSRSHNDLACFDRANPREMLVKPNLTTWSAASYSTRVARNDGFVVSRKPRFTSLEMAYRGQIVSTMAGSCDVDAVDYAVNR